MYVEGFGKQNVKFYEIEGTNELFLAFFSCKNKDYSSVIDNKGRALIPFSDVPIQEIFSTNNHSSYCFSRFSKNEKNYESFHLMKEDDDKFHVRADIKGDDHTNCRLIGTEKDNYWLIESTTDGITEFNLYDVKNARILTPKFTEISFEKEESRVLAYVEKDIYGNIDGEIIYLTTLTSFIDYDGNFITSIYDIESDTLYDARSYNFDNRFRRFNIFINNLSQEYTKKYTENQKHITEVQVDMFNNLYSPDDLKLGEKTKILSYRRDSSND